MQNLVGKIYIVFAETGVRIEMLACLIVKLSKKEKKTKHKRIVPLFYLVE